MLFASSVCVRVSCLTLKPLKLCLHAERWLGHETSLVCHFILLPHLSIDHCVNGPLLHLYDKVPIFIHLWHDLLLTSTPKNPQLHPKKIPCMQILFWLIVYTQVFLHHVFLQLFLSLSLYFLSKQMGKWRFLFSLSFFQCR